MHSSLIKLATLYASYFLRRPPLAAGVLAEALVGALAAGALAGFLAAGFFLVILPADNLMTYNHI